MTAQRAQDAVDTPLETPDGIPIEELPGWDAERRVFVLDRSRTAAARHRARADGRRAPEQSQPVSQRRRK